MGECLSKLWAAKQRWGLGHEVIRQSQQQTLLKRVPHQLKAPRQTQWAKARWNLNHGQAQ
jgi:hypothetical protein